MNELYYTVSIVLIEFLYFKLAVYYNIIDKPNERSSHTTPIIRGGGIIFIFSIWYWVFLTPFQWYYFLAGATLVAIISFADDIKPQSSLLRFFVHLAAIVLLFVQADIYGWNAFLVLLAGIVCIGTLSAFNFMDGINGITGIYGLVNLSTFFYINTYIDDFTDGNLLVMLMLAVVIFLFLNFRTRAACFAGDVGSVTLAFVQIFLLMQLIVSAGSLLWPLIFLVFGIDSVITIIYRLQRRENIFKPHRSHLYQYLTNEMKWDHRLVSIVYGAIQLVINIFLVIFLPQGLIIIPLVVSGIILITYMALRVRVLDKIKQAA